MLSRLRAIVLEALRFFNANGRLPSEATLRREQASILYQTTRLYFIFGISTSSLFITALQGWDNQRVTWAYFAVSAAYLALLLASVRWRRGGTDSVFVRSATFLFLCLGSSWGSLVVLLAINAPPNQEAVLIGLSMALVSSPILCVPLSAAMAFYAPATVACLYMVTVMIHVGYAADVSFVGYIAFALTGIVYVNKIIMDRLVGRMNLQREHEIVRVFLREYEEVSTDWLWEIDTHHRLCNVAPRLVEVLGVPAERLEKVDLLDPSQFNGTVISESHGVVAAIRNRVAFRDRVIAVTRAGTTRWLNLTGHPVHDDKGEFRGYRGIGSDITTARLDQQRIEFMARHDGLTRLLGRRTFVSETGAALERQPDRSRALLLVDLDDFKQVNDDLGHAAGDALLETVAVRLLERLGPDELAARIGGDEFALLIETTDPASAMARAALLNKALRIEAGAKGTGLLTSASIGVAVTPDHGVQLDELMRRADFALYEAKKQGKGMAALFEMRMETAFLSRQRLLGELGPAIEQNQIFPEFQPIVDVGSGQIVSAEALVRWAHPTRGLLTAGSFVLAAEGSDLIEPLGAHVLRLACEAAMSWPTQIPVSVNLSPRQLRSGRFVKILTECLGRTGLPPKRLILEVTETVFLDAGPRIIHQIDIIRAMGVRLVLDDFGTGYSSLTYLRRFEVDGIKIDASFVRDLPGSRKVGAIVRTIGRLASDMNIYVTAEGVETEEQLRWLRGNGIAFAQGYLLGRPGADPVDSIARAASSRDPAASPRTVEHGRA